MLNNTEYNNTVICVLPKNVEMPHPNSRKYDEYCKKYAPKYTRQLCMCAACVNPQQVQSRLVWQVSGNDIYAKGVYDYYIIKKMSSCDLLITTDDLGLHICDIPSLEETMLLAEKYDKSESNYCTYDIPSIAWANLLNKARICEKTERFGTRYVYSSEDRGKLLTKTRYTIFDKDVAEEYVKSSPHHEFFIELLGVK